MDNSTPRAATADDLSEESKDEPRRFKRDAPRRKSWIEEAHAHTHAHAPPNGPRPVALSSTAQFALIFAFLSFATFAVFELVFALVANSLAMLGDAASMLVDASTYLFNLYAVSCADKKGRLADGVRLFAPAVSALVLSGITVWIMVSAVQELAAPASPVNTALMLLFGSINLAIDGANLAAFRFFPEAYASVLQVAFGTTASGQLNMRSALTHIIADTFRSFAVIGAALTADWTPASASHADAVAALLVAVPIVVMTILLLATVALSLLASSEQPDESCEDGTCKAPYHDMGLPPHGVPPPCLSALPFNEKGAPRKLEGSLPPFEELGEEAQEPGGDGDHERGHAHGHAHAVQDRDDSPVV